MKRRNDYIEAIRYIGGFTLIALVGGGTIDAILFILVVLYVIAKVNEKRRTF